MSELKSLLWNAEDCLDRANECRTTATSLRQIAMAMTTGNAISHSMLGIAEAHDSLTETHERTANALFRIWGSRYYQMLGKGIQDEKDKTPLWQRTIEFAYPVVMPLLVFVVLVEMVWPFL